MSKLQKLHLYSVDLDRAPLEASLPRPLMHQDALADAFTLSVTNGGEPVSLADVTVRGYLINATRQTLPLQGAIAGNTVCVTLTDACYALPGLFSLAIQLEHGDIRTTLLRLDGQITRTATDAMVASGQLLPTMAELLTLIEDARTAAAAASAAAAAATPPILLDASGSLITLTDGAARPAAALCTVLDPLQDGEGNPSPDNIRALNSRESVTLFGAGRNLLVLEDESFTRGAVAVTVDKRGVLTFSGTSTLTSTATVNLAPMTLPAGTYTLSGTVTGGTLTSNSEGATIAFVKVGETYHRVRKNALSVTFTLGSRQEVFIGCMVAAGGAVYEDYAVQIQLECGSAATPWQPSAAVAVTAVLPEPVPGGAIDWLSGAITVDRMLITFDGTENWGQNNSVSNTVRLTTPEGAASVALCSHYICRSVSVSSNDLSVSIGTQLNVRDSVNAVDVETWKAYLAAQAAAGTPVTLLCTRSAPATLSIDPLAVSLLRGENALWCDCGDTSLTYVADTRLYIDQRLAAITAASLDV